MSEGGGEGGLWKVWAVGVVVWGSVGKGEGGEQWGKEDIRNTDIHDGE